jgi:phage terminase large subunit-like protein
MSIDPSLICPAQLLTPEVVAGLSDAEILALAYEFEEILLRPDQRIPRTAFRYLGWLAGRGWGKTLDVAAEINRRVSDGEASHISLVAPTEERVVEVQHKALIDNAPPWFRPESRSETLIWPNGVQALAFSPERPERPRGENSDLAWCTEIVGWQHTTRLKCWNNVTTANRVGPRPQVFWDTTSSGKNEVLDLLLAMNRSNPEKYPIIRGTMFDNPLLSKDYIESECAKYTGRQYDEEVLGLSFTESAGALFQQIWLNENRVPMRPTNPDLTIVSCDPALSGNYDADECGIVRLSRTSGHVYVEEDFSGRMGPESWGDIVVRECVDRGAAGATVERNHLGDAPTFILKSRASTRGYSVRVLTKDQPFPQRTPGVIYVREYVAASSKTSRAGGPAGETQAGRVHMVGVHPQLEHELTTYEPGTRRSPNRYDAFVYGVIELRGLAETKIKTTPEQIAGAAEVGRRIHAELTARTKSRRI